MITSLHTWFAKQRLIGQLNSIKRSVDNQLTYKHYNAKDFRAIKEGEKAEGNCAVFAATYADRLENAGFKPCIYYGPHKVHGIHAVCIIPTEHGPFVMDNFGRSVWPYNPRDWKGLRLYVKRVSA